MRPPKRRVSNCAVLLDLSVSAPPLVETTFMVPFWLSAQQHSPAHYLCTKQLCMLLVFYFVHKINTPGEIYKDI